MESIRHAFMMLFSAGLQRTDGKLSLASTTRDLSDQLVLDKSGSTLPAQVVACQSNASKEIRWR